MYDISGIGKVDGDLWFTSDTLFWDHNALNDRSFKYMKDMNEEIISRWNDRIGYRDIVYHLGNVSTGTQKQTKDILKKLNGRINLIVGNKDSNSNVLSFRNMLASCNYRLEITVNRYILTLNHYPQLRWNEDRKLNSFMLHGFSRHKTPPQFGKLTLDVGVDGFNLKPIHFEEILNIMDKKKEYFEWQNRKQQTYL